MLEREIDPRSDPELEEERAERGAQLRFRLILTVLLAAIAASGTADLLFDGDVPWRSVHAAVEVGFIAMCLGAVVWLWTGWIRTHEALTTAERHRIAAGADRDRWRARASTFLRGLGEAIDAEFDGWGLTPKEREIALLLLKGYGLKEIADLHGRSERTVRQQAGSVYKKAGLAGRAELAAYFLEDLLLPRDADSDSAESEA